MKLSLRTSLATFAIVAIVATPAVPYMAAESFDRLAQSDNTTEIMSTSAQNTVTVLVGLEV